MEAVIEKSFEIEEPIDKVWANLSNPMEVASCVPGAAITQKIDDTNFELKINSKENTLNKVFLEKMINLTTPEDIVTSFDWETILSNRKSFKSKYGILIDKENQLFESKAMSNLDEKLMFMVEKEIFYSRNFDLPLERCVVWTVNDKAEIDNVLNMNVYGVVTDIGDKL